MADDQQPLILELKRLADQWIEAEETLVSFRSVGETLRSVLQPPLQHSVAADDGNQNQRRVLFINELAHRLGCSRKTIERRLQAGTFPVRPLRSIDNRKRWSEADVEAYERRRSAGDVAQHQAERRR